MALEFSNGVRTMDFSSSLNKKVAGIFLAAGASVRMGKPKQLLPAGHETVLERVLNEALKSDLDKVVLVLGHQAEEIRSTLGKILRHPKLKVIENRHYRQGMSTSIITGLIEVEDTYDHVMVILGDMPHIDSSVINQLLHRYLDSRFPMGAVKAGKKRTHPVIFSRELYDELHNLKGDVGGRSLFRKYGSRVCLVEPGKPYDDRDLDTPEDYADFLKGL